MMLIDAEAELIPVLTPVITTTTGSSIMGASSSLDNGNGRGRVQPNLFTCPQCGYCAGIIYLGAEYSPSIGQTGEMTTLVTQSLFLESQAVRGDRGVCKMPHTNGRQYEPENILSEPPHRKQPAYKQAVYVCNVMREQPLWSGLFRGIDPLVAP